MKKKKKIIAQQSGLILWLLESDRNRLTTSKLTEESAPSARESIVVGLFKIAVSLSKAVGVKSAR